MIEIYTLNLERELKNKVINSIKTSDTFQRILRDMESTIEMIEEFRVKKLPREITLKMEESNEFSVLFADIESKVEITTRDLSGPVFNNNFNSSLKRIHNQLLFLLKLERSKFFKNSLNNKYNFN